MTQRFIITEASQWHTDTPHSVPPLDEESARRRDLYLTTHHTNYRQTSMPPAGLERPIPASEQPQTDASDPAPTEISDDCGYWVYFYIIVVLLAKYNSRPFALSHTALTVGAVYSKGICKQILTVYNFPPGPEMQWCTDCARYVEGTLSEPLWLHCPPILNALKMKVYIYLRFKCTHLWRRCFVHNVTLAERKSA